jgi:hypothetical protein
MERMSLKCQYASLATQFYPQIILPSQVSSLQEKAAVHGEVQTLETTLFLEKPMYFCMLEKLVMRGPHVFTEQ